MIMECWGLGSCIPRHKPEREAPWKQTVLDTMDLVANSYTYKLLV